MLTVLQRRIWLASGGGILRGGYIAAFQSFFGSGTNNVAETRSLLVGLHLCVDLGFRNIVIQSDSLLACKWFVREFSIPWFLKAWWCGIWDVAKGLNLTVSHIYREANSIADL